MTRRDFLSMAAPAAMRATAAPRITVPVHRIVDARVKNPQS
jgi:anaerobic selenocysteine-containing dehydrogenase